jgi:hypothetical protein
MVLYLTIVGLAKADDANAIRCFRETQDVKSPAEISERDIAGLSIGFPPVNVDLRSLEIELHGALERQTTFADVAFVLARIEADAHRKLYAQSDGLAT